MPLIPLSGGPNDDGADADYGYLQMEALQDLLISKFTADLTSKNCIIVDQDRFIPMLFGGLYLQIYAEDSNFDMDGGGNIGQEWHIGISIRERFQIDQPQKYVAATQTMRNSAIAVRNVIHLAGWLSVDINGVSTKVFPIPPRITHQSSITESHVAGEGEYAVEFCIRLTFEVQTIEVAGTY